MTCIVGIRQQGHVWIGGDSAGVAGLDIRIRRDPKVFLRDGVAFGFSSSFRMGQLLMARLQIPEIPPRQEDLLHWMVGDFVDAVRDCFKRGGFARRDGEVESGGFFMVGLRGGRIFIVESDYQVAESSYLFNALGCGADYALGAMHAARTRSPVNRLLVGLRAAAAFSAGVSAPFSWVRAEA